MLSEPQTFWGQVCQLSEEMTHHSGARLEPPFLTKCLNVSWTIFWTNVCWPNSFLAKSLLTKLFFDQKSVYQIVFCQMSVDQTFFWLDFRCQNGFWTKCLSAKLDFWPNVYCPNWFQPNVCLSNSFLAKSLLAKLF